MKHRKRASEHDDHEFLDPSIKMIEVKEP